MRAADGHLLCQALTLAPLQPTTPHGRTPTLGRPLTHLASVRAVLTDAGEMRSAGAMAIIMGIAGAAAAAPSAPAAGPFALQLRPQFRFAWNISADGILHADMSTNETGWLGFGLSPTAFLTFHGMNHADMVVATWAPSGACRVEDYYNPSDFEKAPQLDTALSGTDDVLSYACSHEDGWTHARWSRRLSTGDLSADWNVTQGWNHIILAAPAGERELAYHGAKSTAVCEIDFFKGLVKKECAIFW